MNTSYTEIQKLTESDLHDFIAKHPEGAHLKDTVDFKYIDSNDITAQIFNLSRSDDLIGLTTNDLDTKFMRKFWGDKYADNIAAVDHQVKSSGEMAVTNNDILLNAYNQVRIQNLIKFPFKGANNKVTAILTIAQDLTKNLDLFLLWNLYKQLHKNMESALNNFADYLQIDRSSFAGGLTEKNILDILSSIKNQAYRYSNLH